jgi:Flp pilus assembly protein TadG
MSPSNPPPDRARPISGITVFGLLSRAPNSFRLRRFFARKDGATAIEFAIVAPVFFLILLGLLDLALLFATNVSVDLSVSSFAKQIRTGQIQAPGTAATSSSGVQMSLSDAKTWICQKMILMPTSICTGQLQLDVRPITFQQMSGASPISGTQFNSNNLCYYSGNAGDVVEIRAYYLYPLLDPMLTAAFALIKSYQSGSGSSSGNYFPILSTQVFKSENYKSSSNTGAGC